MSRSMQSFKSSVNDYWVHRDHTAHFNQKTQRRWATLVAVIGLALASACSIGPRANSPDALYSSNAAKARQLQVPPDLNDVSAEEQFVLPGDGNGVISRNTLLPAVGAGRYVREGTRDWLELTATPEALWPRLLRFVEDEGFTVDATEPLSGTINTQWRAAGGESGSLAGGVARGSEVRLSLRLERLDDAAGSRLFARYQVSRDRVEDSALWSSDASQPENSSIALRRFLAYLGIENQAARGLISEAVAERLLQGSELESSESGMTLVVHRGLKPSYDAIGTAVKRLGMKLDTRASTATAMNLSDPDNRFADATAESKQFVLLMQAEHVSKIIVEIANIDGTKLEREQETRILGAIQQVLSGEVGSA